MKKYKELMITTIVCLLPMAIGAYFYDQLPAQVPVHWDSAGPNGWASRAFACFGLPGILTGLNLLVQITMENDPKKKNYAPVLKVFFKWLIPVLGFVTMIITIAAGLGKEVAVGMIMPVLLGILLIVCGNYLPKCKQNYTMGIKCPWTLHSEENWNKTHHLAGYLYILEGLWILMVSVTGLPSILILISLLVMAAVPFGYSFFLYKKGI